MLRAPDHTGWRRKHDDPRDPAFVPAGAMRGHFHPGSLQEVIRIVTEAEMDAVPFVRACGSHWSLSQAVCEPGYEGRIVETHALNRTLYDIVPGCLSSRVREDLLGQPQAVPGTWDEDAYTLYHVEAGVRVCDLYSRLDGLDPLWPAPTDGLAAPGLRGPWALPTLGTAGGQTIAGAISTSTHGSDHRLPPLVDAVQAVHMVCAGGYQFWIERARFSDRVPVPMCDPAMLKAALSRAGDGRVEIIQDDDALNAVLVSVGRMGIIYSVVLRVVRSYGLEETRHRRPWDDVQRGLLDPASSLFSQRFLQVVLNPLPGAPGQAHSCWVVQRRAIPIPHPLPDSWRGRVLRGLPGVAGASSPIDKPPDTLYARLCASNSLASLLGRGAALAQLVAICAHLWRRRGVALGASIVGTALAGLALCYRGSLGDVIAGICNLVARTGNSLLLSRMLESFLAADQTELTEARPLRDFSYAVLDRHNYADRACITGGDALEVAFDAGSDTWLKFINESLFVRTRQLVEGSLTGRRSMCAAYVSVRFTGRTRALLGIQRWDRTCLIAIAGLKGFDGLALLLDTLESDAVALGATVHWGQRNNLTRRQVEASYPDLPTWRKVLRRVSAHGNPQSFSTAYSRRTGLES